MNIEEQVFKLTTALYRVTDHFPKDEILTSALRKQGLKIIKLVVVFDDNEEKIIKNLKVMSSYLQVAKKTRVTNPINLEVLQREYQRLAEYFLNQKPAGVVQQKSTVSDDNRLSKNTELNDRQKMIIEYLKKKKQARVGGLQNIFKNISSKTIQRDLHGLVVKKILTRDGDKRWTTYKLTDKVR